MLEKCSFVYCTKPSCRLFLKLKWFVLCWESVRRQETKIIWRLFGGLLPQTGPSVHSFCLCRGVNHYQNARKAYQKGFESTHTLNPAVCKEVCARLLNPQLVCEEIKRILKSASADCGNSALLCSLEVVLLVENSLSQVTKAVKSPGVLTDLLAANHVGWFAARRGTLAWNPSWHAVWVRSAGAVSGVWKWS